LIRSLDYAVELKGYNASVILSGNLEAASPEEQEQGGYSLMQVSELKEVLRKVLNPALSGFNLSFAPHPVGILQKDVNLTADGGFNDRGLLVRYLTCGTGDNWRVLGQAAVAMLSNLGAFPVA
jgi:hypothetical protein